MKSFMFLNHEIKISYKNNFSKIHPLMQTGEIPHICLVCIQEFSEKSKLDKNRFTHVDVKPNMCVMCMKGFYKKMVLE